MLGTKAMVETKKEQQREAKEKEIEKGVSEPVSAHPCELYLMALNTSFTSIPLYYTGHMKVMDTVSCIKSKVKYVKVHISASSGSYYYYAAYDY